jgi:hypothetical protein
MIACDRLAEIKSTDRRHELEISESDDKAFQSDAVCVCGIRPRKRPFLFLDFSRPVW